MAAAAGAFRAAFVLELLLAAAAADADIFVTDFAGAMTNTSSSLAA